MRDFHEPILKHHAEFLEDINDRAFGCCRGAACDACLKRVDAHFNIINSVSQLLCASKREGSEFVEIDTLARNREHFFRRLFGDQAEAQRR